MMKLRVSQRPTSPIPHHIHLGFSDRFSSGLEGSLRWAKDQHPEICCFGLSRPYPPFRKHCAREKKLSRNYFPRDCAKLSQLIVRKNSWGIVFGGLRNFVVALCFLTVPVACFQEWICAMAILSWRQKISEELFVAGLRQIRAIIARNSF